ncbi:MAG TPA: type II toxin-antitoxin system prevent-host-death family antitoxin [Gemmatimonadaceae bacterium]|nr:type II toxin-antitoxin system prevent-host-death family antitoxin [Gemmatimonadaceae bacterium]HPV75990.1 type II toxin-antitoxin system prevent-host-death family antitoxin [Gemmatimonadaceae bacterium]
MTRSHPKTVKVAELKANLSAYLRAAREGHQVTVCDRDTPVARLVPFEAGGEVLVVRRALRALHDFRLPAPLKPAVDSLAALRTERQSER